MQESKGERIKVDLFLLTTCHPKVAPGLSVDSLEKICDKDGEIRKCVKHALPVSLRSPGITPLVSFDKIDYQIFTSVFHLELYLQLVL